MSDRSLFTRMMLRRAIPVTAVLVAGCDAATNKPNADAPAPLEAGWAAYGGDAGGSRYSPLDQINRENVQELEVAWTARTGDWSHMEGGPEVTGPCQQCHTGDYKFETTPILARDRLYLGTPFNRAVALDPASGQELWRFDPGVDSEIKRNEGMISRGVSFWEDPAGSDGPCQARVFLPTVDARLIALDADSGEPCPDFGEAGTIRLDLGVGEVVEGMYGVTSPPAVVGDAVIVGSSIGDRHVLNLEHGTVRAYDARTGALLWSWDPIPRSPEDPGWETWTPEAARRTGGGNAWAPLSADAERDMVFIPTGAVSSDYYGGERPGANLFSSSVVALRASTGQLLWHFQTVHHDIWDYDVAAQPTLTTVPRGGELIPAVVVGTKTGLIFVLNRETGEPLFPVEERPVPASTVPGEQAWPTQPFPVVPRPLHPHEISPEDAWGLTPEDREACRSQMASLRNEGIYTPPSPEGTLMFPGFGGGINWGGVAVDQANHVLAVNVMRLPMWVSLTPRSDAARASHPMDTPYSMSRGALISPSGTPCSEPPWGTLAAVDLESAEVLWEVPFGTIGRLADVPGSAEWGSLNLGGPMITAGGLLFIGAAMDEAIRAYDIETGEELWKAELPAGGNATPMTYESAGKQYVVIVAGGHSRLGTELGDHVVAFALP
jgi:quinoprotein glucose dehydrogenase